MILDTNGLSAVGDGAGLEAILRQGAQIAIPVIVVAYPSMKWFDDERSCLHSIKGAADYTQYPLRNVQQSPKSAFVDGAFKSTNRRMRAVRSVFQTQRLGG